MINFSFSQNTFGLDDIATTGTLMNFAMLRQHQGVYEDAEPTLFKVRTIVEEAYGTEDPRLIPVIEQIGSLYTAMGRDDEAANFFAEAADLTQRTK